MIYLTTQNRHAHIGNKSNTVTQIYNISVLTPAYQSLILRMAIHISIYNTCKHFGNVSRSIYLQKGGAELDIPFQAKYNNDVYKTDFKISPSYSFGNRSFLLYKDYFLTL